MADFYRLDEDELVYADDLTDEFDEFLDNTGREAIVDGRVFSPSEVLKECDPIGYTSALNDWADMEAKDESWLTFEGSDAHLEREEELAEDDEEE